MWHTVFTLSAKVKPWQALSIFHALTFYTVVCRLCWWCLGLLNMLSCKLIPLICQYRPAWHLALYPGSFPHAFRGNEPGCNSSWQLPCGIEGTQTIAAPGMWKVLCSLNFRPSLQPATIEREGLGDLVTCMMVGRHYQTEGRLASSPGHSPPKSALFGGEWPGDEAKGRHVGVVTKALKVL